MNTCKNATRGGGIFASKKLLAALAVLAVAFVVLAAVPAVATDSDATEDMYDTGLIAAGYVDDSDTANSVMSAIKSGTYTLDDARGTMFAAVKVDSGTTYSWTITAADGTYWTEEFTGDGAYHVHYTAYGTYSKDSGIVPDSDGVPEKGESDVDYPYEDISKFEPSDKNTYTITVKIGEKSESVTIKGDSVFFKQGANLLNTITVSVDGEMTFDLGGKTVSSEKRALLIDKGNVVVENGTLAAKISNNSSVIRLDGSTTAASLIINKGATIKCIKNDTTGAWAISSFGGVSGTPSTTTNTIKIYGKVLSEASGITSAGNSHNNKLDLSVHDGAVIEAESVAFYLPGRGTTEISGGTITGATAIGIKSGTLEISGGTITGTQSPASDGTGYSNGIYATGAAIQIESNKDYYGNTSKDDMVQVDIIGGSIVSKAGVGIYEYLADETSSTSVKSISVAGGKVSGFLQDIMVSDGAKDLVTVSSSAADANKASVKVDKATTGADGKSADDQIKAAIEEAGTAVSAGSTTLILTNVGAAASGADSAINMKSLIKEATDAGYKSVVIVLANGATFTSDPVVLEKDGVGSISISSVDTGYSGTIKLGASATANAAVLNGVKGSFTITYGSVILDGAVTGGTITISEDSRIADGTVLDGVNVRVTGDYKLEIGNSTLKNGASLTVDGKMNVIQTAGTTITLEGASALTIGKDAIVASDLDIVGGTVSIAPSMSDYDLTLTNVTKVTSALSVKTLTVAGSTNITFDKQVDAGSAVITNTRETKFSEAFVTTTSTVISSGKVTLGYTTVPAATAGGNPTYTPSSIQGLELAEGAELTASTPLTAAKSSTTSVIAGTSAGKLIGTFNVASGSSLTVTDSAETISNAGTVYIGTAQDNDNAVVNKLTNKGTAVVYGKVTGIDNSKNVRLYGTITGGKNTGTIYVMDKKASVGNVSGDGSIDISAITETIEINGSIAAGLTTYALYQTVIITKDTEMKAGAVVKVHGNFIVNEGVTLTIDDGASLVAEGSVALITNNGAILVNSDGNDDVVTISTTSSGASSTTTSTTVVDADDYAGLEAGAYSQIVNNGTIALGYSFTTGQTTWVKTMTVGSDAVVSNNGTIAIGTESNLTVTAASSSGSTTTAAGRFVNASGSALTVLGLVTGAIENAGSVVISSAEAQNLTISLSGASATVTVTKLVGNLTVDDTAYTSTASSFVKGTDTATITVNQGPDDKKDKESYAGGLTISFGTHSYKDGSKTKTNPMLVLSGALTLSTSKTDSKAYATFAIESSDKMAAEFKDLTIGDGVLATLKGTAKVTGDVVVAKGGYLYSATSGSGRLLISGSVTSIGTDIASDDSTLTGFGTTSAAAIAYEGAAYVETPAATAADQTKTYHYTTVAAAITAADGTNVKTVTVYGGDDVAVSEDAVLLSGVTLTLNGNTGKNLTIKSGSTLLVSNGASIALGTSAQAKIVVEGKLVFENAKTGQKGVLDIVAEVISIKDPTYTYTSLTTALSEVGGEDTTIELQGDASIKQDTTIPSNVTVKAAGNTIVIYQEITLTVEGTLYLNENAKIAYVSEATKTDYPDAYNEDKDVGEIDLAGYIESDTALTFASMGLYGAYYTTSDTTYSWITAVANAPAVAPTADGQTVTIYAEKVSDDLVFAGTEDAKLTIVIAKGDVEAAISMTYGKLTLPASAISGALTVSNGSIVVAAGAVLDVNVIGANGSVSYTDAVVSKETTFTAGVDSDKTTETLTVKGAVVPSVEKNADPAQVISGTVYFSGYTSGVYTSVEGNLVTKETVVLADVTVYGTLTASNSSKLTVAAVEILGSVTVAPKDDTLGSAGSLSADGIYLGTTVKTITGTPITGSDASLTAPAGKVAFNVLYLAPGAIVSGGFEEDLAKAKNTAYYVDDSLFLTVYGTSVDIASVGYDAEDARFDGWYDADDSKKTVIQSGVKTGSIAKVIAKLDANVYFVSITADAGVGTVALNGIILFAMGNNFSNLTGLPAGTYTVALTANSGYDTSKTTIVDSEGNTVTSIVLSGDYRETAEYYISGSVQTSTGGSTSGGLTSDDIQGIIDAIDKNTEATENIKVEGGSSKDSSLTDILLIVLVILIVIMAALVAMRMLRN